MQGKSLFDLLQKFTIWSSQLLFLAGVLAFTHLMQFIINATHSTSPDLTLQCWLIVLLCQALFHLILFHESGIWGNIFHDNRVEIIFIWKSGGCYCFEGFPYERLLLVLQKKRSHLTTLESITFNIQQHF